MSPELHVTDRHAGISVFDDRRPYGADHEQRDVLFGSGEGGRFRGVHLSSTEDMGLGWRGECAVERVAGRAAAEVDAGEGYAAAQ